MTTSHKNRVLETVTTVGAGAYTLGGLVLGYQTALAAGCIAGETYGYFAEAIDANGALTGAFEVGEGTYTAGVLTSTSVSSSSNSGAKVSWTAGTKRIGLTLTAETLVSLASGGGTVDLTTAPVSTAQAASIALKANTTALDAEIARAQLAEAGKASQATTYTKTEDDANHAQTLLAIGAKANTATTLAGYGIADSYTATVIDGKLSALVLASGGGGGIADWTTMINKPTLASGAFAVVTGTNTGDQVIPTTLPASDVSAWAKAAVKPSYTLTELGAQAAGTYVSGSGSASGANTGDETATSIKTKLGVTVLTGSNSGDQVLPTLASLGAQPAGTYASGTGSAEGVNTGDQVIPTTLPASDVSAWAKAATRPTYTASDVGAAEVVHTHSYQAADGDLLAIGGLVGNNGILRKTAADTWTLDTATYATGTGTAVGVNTGDQVIPVASSTAPAALGIAAIGTGLTFARADHVHTAPIAYALPTSSVTVLGGVKVGSGLSIDASGVLSAAGATNIGQGTNTATAVVVTSSTGTSATLAAATTTLAGVQSAADKTKLNGLTALASFTLQQGDLIFGGVGGEPTRLAKPTVDGQVFFNTSTGAPYYGPPIAGADGISVVPTPGPTTTLAAGTSAFITVTGTTLAPIWSFSLPRGEAALAAANAKLIAPTEVVIRVATAATGTMNLDAGVSGSYYYTTLPSAANFILNIRSTALQTLNALLAVSETKVVVCTVLNGATAYRPTAIHIDGVLISTPAIMWSGKAAPTVGTANGKDAYVLVITKTGNGTWEIMANQTVYG